MFIIEIYDFFLDVDYCRLPLGNSEVMVDSGTDRFHSPFVS